MKEGKIVILVMLNILLLNMLGCSSHASPKKEWEAIRDMAFENGFALTPLDPIIVQENGGFEKTCVDTLYFERQDVIPVWKMAQWYSKYNLGHVAPVRNQDGSIVYESRGKKVVWNMDGCLWLEINTSHEYDRPRQGNEPWPHLLIEQSFVQHPNIGKVKQLDFSIEMKLEKCERKMSDCDYNPEIHTAQSPFYFVLKNVNERSKDFNSFIWFGIPSYDYRYQRTTNQETISWDIGTSTYIYNVPQLPVWGDISFQDKQWHQAKVDVLPLIKKGIEKMREKGYFKDTLWDDIEICGMNFGWEIPGTFDVAISVKNISLKVINN